ncbi:MAG: Hsp70 family protein [Acidobacteriaceae bacterium]
MIGIGIDFGTTNSCVSMAVAGREPGVVSAQFQLLGEPTPTFRSILYFRRSEAEGRRQIHIACGSEAIEQYLADEEKGRLIQSIKSLLGSATFTSTAIYGRSYGAEDLVAVFLRALLAGCREQLGEMNGRIVVGRPVQFVGAESAEDEQLALARLRNAFAHAGIHEFEFEYEPVAAARTYQHRLTRDEVVLIGDFGGGTSDFSVLALGPSHRGRAERGGVLATVGLPLAGDTFDTRIIRHVVSPLLGYGTEYRSFGKDLSVPSWFYSRLERWHYLSLLKSRETLATIRSVQRTANQPLRLAALRELVEDDLGFRLHQAVQQTKIALSRAEEARFHFELSSIAIETQVSRGDFERWIGEDLHSIERSVDEVLAIAGLAAEQIDRVFLTGGSSFVPSVRRIFEQRFGSRKLTGGDNFTSVATGLAIAALGADD